MGDTRREDDGAAGTAKAELRLLGQFRLEVDGRRIDAVRTPRLESLIAYLAVHRGSPVPRSEVAFALWPDSTEPQALTNLRRELHDLRRALPDAGHLLHVERRTIEWRFGPLARLDLADFEAALERGRAGDVRGLVDAVGAYGGDLLPSSYDEWIAPERERLRSAFMATLGSLATRCEERREFSEATGYLRRLVQVDPLNEGAFQSLIRIAATTGDRAAGLQAYHACVTNLERELGVEPGRETKDAYERLLKPSVVSTPVAPVAPSLQRDRSESPSTSRRESPAAALQPLVGRRRESHVFLQAWQHLSSGPRLLLLAGEPGIGKTRLIEHELRWAGARRCAAVYTRSYAAEGRVAYGPVTDWLRAPPVRAALSRLEPIWQFEIARLIPELRVEVSAPPPPEPMPGSWQRGRLFEALVEAFRGLPQPVLLVLDDAHWADEDTLEWLHYLLRADPPPSVLVVAGVRSDELRSNAALTALVSDLRARGQVDEIELGALDEDETAELGASVVGHVLDADAKAGLFRATGGYPLFIVELAHAGLDAVVDPQQTSESPRLVPIPPRMQAVISARLDQLSPIARELLETAAAVGRDFTFELLARSSDLEEAVLARALDELWQRRIVREHGLSSYDVRHDRIRDVAYALMSPIRRRLAHRRIAQAIELLHAADLDPVAAQLGGHYELAGMPADAVRFYEQAGIAATGLSANGEAIHHLEKALAMLRQLPASRERDRRELSIVVRLPAPLNGVHGYASSELEDALVRIRTLARDLGERSEEVGALSGMSAVHFVRAEFRQTLEFADTALALAAEHGEFLAAAHMGRGWPLLALGELQSAIEAFENALASYEPGRSKPYAFGFDAATFAMASESHALWLSGRWTDAVALSAEAVERATRLDQPHLRAMSHAYAAVLHQFRGAADEMRRHAEAASDLSRRYELAYYGEWGAIVSAWADRMDPGADSAGRIERALASLRVMRAETRRPYYLALLAETHLAAGRDDAARAVLTAALTTANANDDRWWLPEIHRLLAEFDLSAEGDGHLDTALRIAREQGARSLAVRVALSLARRRKRGRAALVEVLASLPERGRGPDLEAAEALLATQVELA